MKLHIVGASRVAEPCHFEAAPAPAPAPEPPIFFTAPEPAPAPEPEPAPAPTYLLYALVSWGRIRPAVVVFINFTYFLHKVLST
jgi:hypothetical protein